LTADGDIPASVTIVTLGYRLRCTEPDCRNLARLILRCADVGGPADDEFRVLPCACAREDRACSCELEKGLDDGKIRGYIAASRHLPRWRSAWAGASTQSNFLVSSRQFSCARTAQCEDLVDGSDNHHCNDGLVGVQAAIAN
jgi:hypothetical protein